MNALLCLECMEGALKWTGPIEDDDFEADMKCTNCGHTYHGMGAYSEAIHKKEQKESHEQTH